jgi:hypothetical protein
VNFVREDFSRAQCSGEKNGCRGSRSSCQQS